MTLIDLLLLLLVAAICGSIGQALAGYSLGGCLVSAVVGFIGAFIGLWLARQFGLPEVFAITIGNQTFPIIWSIVGSMVLSLILGLLTRRRVIYR
ncbi:MAG: GlsB/YeaQ/YmgE family stress response membrane protein [Anaerolineales bacterium]|nr:GlsB/YeaQ/YmgE family stress response membrane protein [Anaerolineales bacterium]